MNTWSAADAHPSRRTGTIVLIIFLVSVAVVRPSFFPSLHQIGVWDESAHINRGRALAEGTLPLLSRNPLVAGLYALTYLPVQSSPYWLIHSASVGRVILFSLLWLASFLVARQLAGRASPLVMIALIAISPVLTGLLNNGSNALFTATSGFALWQILSFHRSGALRHLWLCSLFVGLAALSRNEGPVLFAVFLTLAFAMCARAGMIRRGMVACVVPFLILVVGYVAAYGMRTGNFVTGIPERSYFTFEQGHGMAFRESYGTLQYYIEGQYDAQRIFGTAEENDHSVLTAISRHPAEYLARVPRLTQSAIRDLFVVYRWHFALLCFAFMARGIVELIRTRSFMLLAILLSWPAYGVLYLLLCYQAPHLLMPFLSVFGLAAVGVAAVAARLDSRMERWSWCAGLLLLLVLGAAVYREPNDLLAAPLLLLLGLWATWLAADRYPEVRHTPAMAPLILLTLMIIVRFGVVHTAPRTLGSTPEEQAALYLRDRFAPGTGVAAWGPGHVWKADMTHVEMTNLRDMTSSEDVWAWMERENVGAILVDRHLRTYEPAVWEVIRNEIGRGLHVGFERVLDASRAHRHVAVLVRTFSAFDDAAVGGAQPDLSLERE